MNKEATKFAFRHHFVDSCGVNILFLLGFVIGLVNFGNPSYVWMTVPYVFAWLAVNFYYFHGNYVLFVDDQLHSGTNTTAEDFEWYRSCKVRAMKKAFHLGMSDISWVKLGIIGVVFTILRFVPAGAARGYAEVVFGLSMLIWLLFPFYKWYLYCYGMEKEEVILNQFRQGR